MILLDTNVIIDLLGKDQDEGACWSRNRYRLAAGSETFASNLIVIAELSASVVSREQLAEKLDRLEIDVLDLDADGAFAAGRAFREYRRRGGKRGAILADFLIAGHAQSLGATLMTRDRRLASYFPDLPLITPETHPDG